MLSALTWNVWFGGHCFDERCEALVGEIGRSDADVIALEEVTPEFLACLRAALWRSSYDFSDPDGETMGDYGVLVRPRAIAARRIELVGVSPVGGDPTLYPSDHFGLRAVFNVG